MGSQRPLVTIDVFTKAICVGLGITLQTRHRIIPANVTPSMLVRHGNQLIFTNGRVQSRKLEFYPCLFPCPSWFHFTDNSCQSALPLKPGILDIKLSTLPSYYRQDQEPESVFCRQGLSWKRVPWVSEISDSRTGSASGPNKQGICVARDIQGVKSVSIRAAWKNPFKITEKVLKSKKKTTPKLPPQRKVIT